MRKRSPADRGQRGIALIAVLWLSVLLVLISAAANRVSRADVAMAANTRVQFSAERAADSAAAFALYTYMTGEDSAWYADGTPYGWFIDGIEVRVSITDERWRVDLNTATEVTLKDMFEELGLNESDAAKSAAEVLAYRDALRSSQQSSASEAQLRSLGFFAFGVVDEIRLATEISDQLAQEVYETATVYTGMTVPLSGVRRILAIPDATVDDVANSQPIPLVALPESPPDKSDILRIQAEARTRDGAHFAREMVVAMDDNNPGRPYTTHMSRRGERRLFEPTE
jgi:hypothetical protein